MDLSNLSPEQIAKLKDTIGNKLWRLNNFYHIRNKENEIVQFKLNNEQSYYIQNRHHRNVNLKARQLGFSTLAVIDAFDDCLFNAYYEAGIIAHSLDDAEKIFAKAKLAYEFLPNWLKKLRKPNTDKAGEYVFPNGSKFSVDTSFRGGTLSRLHVSELAKISRKYPEKAKEIITGAFEAVPKNGFIDIESTAEGVGGEFYDICQVAMNKTGKDLTSLEFKFFFFPWWKNLEYQISANIELSDEFQKYFNYLETEQGITLTKDQKTWYALKKESLKDEMAQEYPSYPEEAFLASGRPVFNQQKISSDIRRAKEKKSEIKRFIIKGSDNKEHIINVRIFEHPKSNTAYAIGADVAEGLAHGDSSTAFVINKDFEQMAVYEGKVDPDIFGEFLVELGLYYNTALLTPELNNHGHATLAAIKRRKYYQIYKRVKTEELSEDMQDKVGWLNTVKSKMKMLDDFKAAYRDDSLKIYCEHTLRQMLTLTIEDDGNIIMNGKDLCVATGLAIQGIGQAVTPGTIGTHESGGKTTFKSLEEMLKYSSRRDSEESYFD